jgi:formimidoylglutamate deiminase
LAKEENTTTFLPDLLYVNGRFESGLALVCGDDGLIKQITPVAHLLPSATDVRLKNRALLPAMVNAHSHSFQRVIRGRTEYKTSGEDSFWTWREAMYAAAEKLTPEDVYDAARMAFLEMVLNGISSVGEFHYLHHQPNGVLYEDPNILAKQVIRAAQDIGIRIALLRVAYFRSGFNKEPNPRQSRFIEKNVDTYLKHLSSLQSAIGSTFGGQSAIGVAPHSLRAVPLNHFRDVVQYANEHKLSIHSHVSEQVADVESCVEEHGKTPVVVLNENDLLNERFVAVHAIHITEEEVLALAKSNAIVCACPTTERNLGDGIVPTDLLFKHGVRVSLGSDSHTQIDLLEDARELEYHLRLQHQKRNVLADEEKGVSSLARKLFECATTNGAESIGLNETRADFFTVDLNDPTIAGANKDDLLSAILFSATRAAIKDVFVGGKQIVKDGKHQSQDEIISRFSNLQRKLWL